MNIYNIVEKTIELVENNLDNPNLNANRPDAQPAPAPQGTEAAQLQAKQLCH